MFYTKNLLNWLQKNKIIKDFTFSVNDKSLKQYFTLQNFTNNNYKTKYENTNNNNYTQINTILEQIPIRKIVHHLHLNLSTDNHPCQCITCSKALITPVEDYHPFTTEFISPNSPIDKTRVCVHCRKSCHLCKQFIILLSTGSYNPVHLGHVNVFKAAKHFLENEQMELLQQIDNKSEIIHQQVKEHENINEKNYLQNFEYWSTWLQQRDCKVVGAYFSPSHQNYVNNKMKEKKSWSIPLKERCLLIDLATEENSYITSSCWEGNQKDFYTFSEITNALTQIMLSEHHPIRILFELKNYDNFTTRNCTTNDFENNNNLFPLDISSNVLPVIVSWNPFHTLQFCYIGGADLMSMAGSNLIYKDYVFTTCVARKGSSRKAIKKIGVDCETFLNSSLSKTCQLSPPNHSTPKSLIDKPVFFVKMDEEEEEKYDLSSTEIRNILDKLSISTEGKEDMVKKLERNASVNVTNHLIENYKNYLNDIPF